MPPDFLKEILEPRGFDDRLYDLLLYGKKHVPPMAFFSAIDSQDRFIAGINHAKLATDIGHDTKTRASHFESALHEFLPLLLPFYNQPEIPLYIGILADVWARKALSRPDLTQEKRLQTGCAFFIEAAAYYTISTEWPSSTMHPHIAANALGDLYEKGLGVKVDLKKAFDLRLSAGEAGFYEAQINCAVMCYLGEGTEASSKRAENWLQKAMTHLKQTDALYQRVLDFRTHIQTHSTTPYKEKDLALLRTALNVPKLG